jgi:hypothetical protein
VYVRTRSRSCCPFVQHFVTYVQEKLAQKLALAMSLLTIDAKVILTA